MMDLVATMVIPASGGTQNASFLKANAVFKAGALRRKNYSELFNKHEALAKTTEHLRIKVWYKQMQLCNLQASECCQAGGYRGSDCSFQSLGKHLILPTFLSRHRHCSNDKVYFGLQLSAFSI